MIFSESTRLFIRLAFLLVDAVESNLQQTIPIRKKHVPLFRKHANYYSISLTQEFSDVCLLDLKISQSLPRNHLRVAAAPRVLRCTISATSLTYLMFVTSLMAVKRIIADEYNNKPSHFALSTTYC